jgi:hypothetical protein
MHQKGPALSFHPSPFRLHSFGDGSPRTTASPLEGVLNMAFRPRKKKVKRGKFWRCPKCHKQVRVHQKRCRTCHQVLKR